MDKLFRYFPAYVKLSTVFFLTIFTVAVTAKIILSI